ncbi:hypothetical protein TRFO_29911 [Tritrichomonas foetus]|uniref:MRH domain-containing protein n=1 Tax=Tritrichomonas foetus TaxID=1144522 RepID=A0A1J4JWL5_9EUKA|nr:hypothetical protein TRFO_29911 [Tritrichomonas foetus]|eukprot:OHT02840.1 hypothetical protein TRFO_29911 [Tritrichomonas foetus]
MILITFLSLAVSTDYNIIRGNCEVLLDKYFFSMIDFKDMDSIQYRPTSSEFAYILRLCSDGATTDIDYFDVFLIQMSSKTGKSVNVITQNSFDYRPLNTANISEGFIYYADSEPFESPKDQSIRTLDLEIQIRCDPSITTLDIQNLIEFSVTDSISAGKFIAKFNHSFGCPKATHPTPTPTPAFQVDCEYIDRLDSDPKRGIWADLSFMNDGPYGIKTIQNVAGVNHYLYFQPCERIQCPPNFICPTKIEYSSAWLCNESLHCDSFGVSNEEYDFRPIDSDLTKGMVLRFDDKQLDRSFELTLTCLEDYPDGHIKWDTKSASISSSSVKVSGKTKEVCLKPIPTTTPHPQAKCTFENEQGNYKVSIDLEKLNKGQGTGWTADVSVMAGHESYPPSKLIYQPCGSVICPADAFCNGDEDAEIWLCFDNDGTLECDGYGLLKYNMTLELFDDDDLSDGVQASYFGDGKRRANVIYQCNENLAEGSLGLPESVNLDYRTLSFFIQSKDVCPKQISPTTTSTTQTKTLSPTLTNTITHTQTQTQTFTKTAPPTLTATVSPEPEPEKRSNAGGGAYFLLIVFCAAILYVVIGILFEFVKSGAVALPNASFWSEFYLCVEEAILFIGSCGKKKGGTQYDKI